MTPEQKFNALISVISIAILAAVVWTLLCDWIEGKLKAWVKRKYGGTDV